MITEPTNREIMDAVGTLTTTTAEIMGAVTALTTFTQTQFAHVATEISGLKADVGELKADVGTLKADVGTLKADVAELKQITSSHTVQLDDLRVDVADLRTIVDRNHLEAMGAARDNRNALRSLKEDFTQLDLKLTNHINDPNAHQQRWRAA